MTLLLIPEPFGCEGPAPNLLLFCQVRRLVGIMMAVNLF